MRTVTYRLDDLKDVVIHIGRAEENLATSVRIDAGKVFAEYPAAVPTMKVINPAGTVYGREVSRDGDLVIWDVTDGDLAAEGQGEMQLTFTENSVIVKSANARTEVCRSIVGGTTPPDPVQDWIDRAEEVLEEVEDAFPTGGTTGQVLAKKSDADFDTEWVDQGSGGTTDYTELENKPQIGGVTLAGNKSLHDLGAAAESDIPDVSGFYTKPAGGIPASDIADGVIPDPEDLIDDTAGEGDTDKVWSADKTDTELADVKRDIDKSPETKDTTKEGVDLDVTDANGNVIVRFADGHIETKNFNSKNVNGVRETTTENVDLDITDESGNVILRLENGNIETSKFHGFQYITFTKQGTTDNQSLTVTIPHSFKKGDKVVLHTERGSYPWNAPWNPGIEISYYEDDRAIVEDTRIDIAYIEHTVTQDTSTFSVVYNGTLPSGSQTVTFCVSLLGDVPVKPNIVRIKKDGTGDYTSVREALDDIGISANDLLNPYRIEIYPGEYDVLADYTDAEIAETEVPYTDNSFVGAKLLNGMHLVGMGTPQETILTGTLDTTKFSADIRGQISTLNLQGSCSIENMTIIGNHMRYAVHDDFGSQYGKQIKRIVKNCIFRGYDVAYTPCTTYGAGMPRGGIDAVFENCDFGENGGMHTGTSTSKAVRVHLIHCKGHGFRIGDNQTDVADDVVSEYRFDGCDFQFISHRVVDTIPHIRITGSGNEPALINAPPSVLYDYHGVVLVPLYRLNANVGDAVEWYQTGNDEHGPRYRAATSNETVKGIVVYKDDNDVYIQLSGYVRTDRAGLETFSLYDYIGLDNGSIAVVQSKDDSFGRIEYVDASGNGYIQINGR